MLRQGKIIEGVSEAHNQDLGSGKKLFSRGSVTLEWRRKGYTHKNVLSKKNIGTFSPVRKLK